ncbi:MAG: transposase, partial [Bacteroidetes bacterium]|nr:transposase [Bacteroidota bacterium]
EEWMIEYNVRRPHESLNNLTPDEWHKKQFTNEITLN